MMTSHLIHTQTFILWPSPLTLTYDSTKTQGIEYLINFSFDICLSLVIRSHFTRMSYIQCTLNTKWHKRSSYKSLSQKVHPLISLYTLSLFDDSRNFWNLLLNPLIAFIDIYPSFQRPSSVPDGTGITLHQMGSPQKDLSGDGGWRREEEEGDHVGIGRIGWEDIFWKCSVCHQPSYQHIYLWSINFCSYKTTLVLVPFIPSKSEFGSKFQHMF